MRAVCKAVSHCAIGMRMLQCSRAMVAVPCLQIDKNVEREVINHRSLLHPNIIRFKEVRLAN